MTTPVLAKDLATIQNSLQDKYKSIQAWSAHFTQDTYVDSIDKTITKKGSILVKKPGKLKLDYTDKPVRSYISNGSKLWVYAQDKQEVQLFKKINKLVAGEALQFLNGFAKLDSEFEVMNFDQSQIKDALIQNKSLDFLELVPRDTESSLNRLILGIDPKSGSVIELTIYNASGNKTHYVFFDINQAPQVTDEVFEFVVPKGVKTTKS